MKPFYDLPESERIALTEDAISRGASLRSRWTVLGEKEASPWNDRTLVAAEWLVGESAVIDIGCGTMALEARLSGARYWPCDICYRDSRTIICDLNFEKVPAVPATAAACLGVLEYLHDPKSFMLSLSQLYKTVVVSYCTVDAPNPALSRRSHGWVNDFSAEEMEALFLNSAWQVTNFQQIDEIQGLWRLRTGSVADTSG